MSDLKRPDYKAALESLRTMFYPNEYGEGYALEAVTLAVDAAIGKARMDPGRQRELCVKHDSFLIDNGDSEPYCSAARRIRTCQFEAVIVSKLSPTTEESDAFERELRNG